MLEELLDDAIIKKVGGRFKLSALMQKRLAALIHGARPLVDLGPSDQPEGQQPDTSKLTTEQMMKIVIQEILQDKIYLDMEEKVRVRAPGESEGPLDFDMNKP
ncbi:MAG: DNA-directed RNA polymerase subunit omega [Thermoguttaceae bacterium]|nr:DNA-directed RNA polymerase subunit omega [Thermoguttaceae bacterium]MDW8037529.1 DNA-directed RNA polymerase subunit omega [Thermoguttaceae bacterium]